MRCSCKSWNQLAALLCALALVAATGEAVGADSESPQGASLDDIAATMAKNGEQLEENGKQLKLVCEQLVKLVNRLSSEESSPRSKEVEISEPPTEDGYGAKNHGDCAKEHCHCSKCRPYFDPCICVPKGIGITDLRLECKRYRSGYRREDKYVLTVYGQFPEKCQDLTLTEDRNVRDDWRSKSGCYALYWNLWPCEKKFRAYATRHKKVRSADVERSWSVRAVKADKGCFKGQMVVHVKYDDGKYRTVPLTSSSY